MTSPNHPQRWPDVQRAFDELIELSPGEQQTRLAEIGRRDAELRRLLERMIAADARGSGRLARIELVLAAGATEPVSVPVDVFHLSGRSISHFRVFEPLAHGGMGVVYRAEDVQLGRDVALKFPHPHRDLDSGIRERFRLEARAAAALDHPNICTIHEVGETDDGQLFIAMPRYGGETLRDRIAREGAIPAADAMAITRQIARGLEAAHRKNIVHRDLKPANVMLLPDGTVKILDFGLAKVPELSLTATRAFLGTVSYMSPEQIRGTRVDPRTDLWSLGIVLFEMLTGKRPFTGDHEVSIGHAIVNEEPDQSALSKRALPPPLASLLASLMQKDPAERCDSAARVVAELDRIERGDSNADIGHAQRKLFTPARTAMAAGTLGVAALAAFLVMRPKRDIGNGGEPPSVAVLAFDNASGDTAYRHVSEGISDELTGILGTIDGLAVAAQVPSDLSDVRRIGSELGVGAVLRGSTRAVGDTLHLEVALLSTRNERTLWTKGYDRPFSELFAVQDEIAAGVATALGVRVAGIIRDRTALRRTEDSDAYDLYLRGRHRWRMRTREGLEAAVAYYEQAIERDPSFPLPYAGLAEAYVNMANYGHRSADQVLALARVAADRAIALNPYFAEAHASRGVVLASRLEFAGAENAFQHALSLNASYSWARHYYSLLLLMLGRTEDARTQNRAALALDALSLPVNATRGIVLLQEGRLDDAIRQLQSARTLAPDFALTNYYLATALLAEGDFTAAERTLEAASEGAPGFPGVPGARAYLYRNTGRKDAADSVIADLARRTDEPRSLANLAFAWAVLGRVDDAMPLLEQLGWDIPSVIELRADPLLRDLRRDPRYAQLLHRLHMSAP